MTVSSEPPSQTADISGTFAIGGELTVHRLGFGAMRLPGVRGEPRPSAAREILREAVRLGIDLIDTAQAYGRSEELIADALHPYPEGLVIATKGGLRRGGHPDGRSERLRADCEGSLRRLRLNTIDLWQLHRIDPEVPLEEQLGAIRELRDEGKIRFVGVSEVSVDELRPPRELRQGRVARARRATSQLKSPALLTATTAALPTKSTASTAITTSRVQPGLAGAEAGPQASSMRLLQRQLRAAAAAGGAALADRLRALLKRLGEPAAEGAGGLGRAAGSHRQDALPAALRVPRQLRKHEGEHEEQDAEDDDANVDHGDMAYPLLATEHHLVDRLQQTGRC